MGPDDSPTFVGPEVIQTATLSKSQAEENIRGLEVRYGCDLSKKRIESDLHKAAVVTNTIQRLEIELQMALMRQREYASKQALYNHVSSMRDLARVSENIDPTLRTPKKEKTEEELALEAVNDAQAAFMRAREKARQLGHQI